MTLVLPEQRREMTRLMSDAGIAPRSARIKSTDEELAALTGARVPSGVAVTIEVPQQPVQAKPKTRASRPARKNTGGGSGGGSGAGGGAARLGGASRGSRGRRGRPDRGAEGGRRTAA